MPIINSMIFGGGSSSSGCFGTISFTGDYTGSLYFTESGCMIVTDLASKMAFLILQTGTNATYSNIYPDSVTVPTGVTYLETNYPTEVTGGSSKKYETFVFTGVEKKVNATVRTGSRDASAKGILPKITIAYA